MHPRSEVAVAAIQSRQHGAISRSQAITAGMSTSAIDHRVRRGRWIPVHAGVYVARETPTSDRTTMWAAWLACGSDSALTGRTAAELYRLGIPPGPQPEVVVPPQRTVRRPGIIVYRRRLRPSDLVTVDGLRAASPAATLVLLAGQVEDNLLAVALDSGLREGFLRPDRIEAYLKAHPNAVGAGQVREMLAIRGTRPIGSVPASEFLECLRRLNLPLPVPEYPVWTPSGERYIDYAYPDRMLAIEIDSIKFHVLDPEGHRRERARQNDLEQLGWGFRRFEPRGIRFDPLGTAMTVAKALGLEPCRWRMGRPRSLTRRRAGRRSIRTTRTAGRE